MFVREASGKTGDKPGPVTGESSKKTSSMNDVQAVAECKAIGLPPTPEKRLAKPAVEGRKKNEAAKALPDLLKCDEGKVAVPPSVPAPTVKAQASGSDPALSLETLLDVLRKLEGAAQQDGWLLYDRPEVIRACKLQGLKITHGQLNALAKNSHGKLVIVGSTVKCCC